MRRLLCLLALAGATWVASAPRETPAWPQPIVKGALVLGDGHEGVRRAREAFLARCGAGAKLLVFTNATQLGEPWSNLEAKRAEGRAELAGFQGIWIEPDTTLTPETYSRIALAKGKGAVVGGRLERGTPHPCPSPRKRGEGFPERPMSILTPMGNDPATPLAEGASWVLRWDGDDANLLGAARAGRFAVGVPAGAVVQIDGRTLFSDAELGIAFAKGPGGDAVVERLPRGMRADWIALRRRAIERTREPFPPSVVARAEVPQGTLFIAGGGGLPDGLLKRFIEASGGPEAPIVFVPCEFAETLPEPGFVEALRRAGAKNVTWIHTKDRNQAQGDPAILDKLRAAQGVWFGGGRQWNFVDSYLDTEAHTLMRDVLRRGGAIGGSSAGASIQSEYMPRGDPLGNAKIIAPGYERGLGFLPGCAVDQHFTQRSRHKDMTHLMDVYPQLLGIGIDESTALIVRGAVGEVVGRGHVFLYDRHKPQHPTGPDYEELKAGDRYDLVSRRIVGL